MKIIFDAVSTMTSKNQTTIPESVRKALGLEKQDKIRFSVLGGGQVLLEKNNTEEEEFEHDPVVGKFLHFLENSMTKIRIPSNPHLNHALTAFANWLGKQIWKTNMPDSPMQINGYTIYEHECFTQQLDRLATTIESQKRSEKSSRSEEAKLLERILGEIENIALNPDSPEYRLGKTLGPEYKFWRRAKFMGRYRLFSVTTQTVKSSFSHG